MTTNTTTASDDDARNMGPGAVAVPDNGIVLLSEAELDQVAAAGASSSTGVGSGGGCEWPPPPLN